MKIWLLTPAATADPAVWKPWFDKAFGFVVQADTEERARELASKEHGDEGAAAWTQPWNSKCLAIGEALEAKECVVLRDFAAA
jgi:hypothetical protein